ncbi:DUF1330 domain-containing protein [Rhizobium sp. G21]|uniref:DUF1330 domain-containing protein n=1 Tax=Rhizobium sp. G21 TaxID=2758439 RepID=UPI001FEED366|nr:DUF1330 domain-containing protein [Rhizobium sp. G21]
MAFLTVSDRRRCYRPAVARNSRVKPRDNQMVSLSPTALDHFFAEPDDSAVVMLNLLQFHPDGGRERHLEYLKLAEPILARFGARILFRGKGLPALTAGDLEGWDAVMLVQYPRRSAFQDMIADPDYQKVFQVGIAAISDIVLQPLKQLHSLD